MRKILLSTFSLFLFGLTLSAQQFTNGDNIISSPAKQKVVYTGFEDMVRPDVPAANNSAAFDRTGQENQLGTTIYDLQTNSAMQNRIVRNEATDEMYAVWTMGLEDISTGVPNRGTGYNTYSDGEWGDEPTERIETVRTGWPSISLLPDGSQVVITHSSDEQITVNRNPDGSWVQSFIPSSAGTGSLWPRSAAGGPDGNSIHCIAVTTPTGNDGTVYEGVSGHLLYHRSLDGGASWDQVDVIIPGLDSTKFTTMGADAYAIDVSGENVAIALFSGFGDIMAAKSTDNGETWSTFIIKDFFVDQYVADMGYDTTLLDPNDMAGAVAAPTTTAYQSSDGSGDVLIDADGMVHVWYGQMYLEDNDLTDGGTSFYPAVDGVRYWKESFGENSTQLIATLNDADMDGNGVFDFNANADFPNVGVGTTSFITSGIDDDGRLFITYAGLSEMFNENANTEGTTVTQHNRHLYVMMSEDGGDTWGSPVDMIRAETVLSDDLLPVHHASYPSMNRNVGDAFLHIVYQLDFEPGTHVSGDMDGGNPNIISHLAVTLDELGLNVSTEEVVDASTFAFEMSPNPAADRVRVSYELPQTAEVTLTITNMMGQAVQVIQNGNHTKGQFTSEIDVNDLATGVYLVQFRANDQIAVQKLVVD